ncbi:MAG: hypothetical protein U0K66_03615 [Paludibacteraceae bacterium]|nr:hypothetical protein [Paludibacteraceae bacterium]
MKNFIYILNIIIASLFFASCEDEGTMALGDDEPCYTILVSAPNVSDTRAYYKEDGENIAVVWENGDIVILDNGSQKYPFVFKGMNGNNGEFYHYGAIDNAGSWTGTVSLGSDPGTTAQTQKKNNVCGEYLKANVSTGINLNNKPTISLLPADNNSLIHIQTKSPAMFVGGSLLKIKGLDQNYVYTVTLGNNPEYVFADQGDVLDIYVAVPAGKTISNGTALKFYFYSYDVVTGSAETGDEYHYYMKCNGAITTANNEVVKMTLPNKPTHAAIQLGLSVKWATMNIGATSDQPGEASFGGYYPWGVPEEHYEYAWDNTKSSKLMGLALVGLNTAFGLAFSEEKGFQGISAKTYQGVVIGDPATSLWGDDWVTPSRAEMEELKSCAYEASFNQWVEWADPTSVIPHVKTNGVYFKGKGSYSNKRIWLPAAGGVHTQRRGTLDSPASNDGCNGIYMTSTRSGTNGFYILPFNGKNGVTIGKVGSWNGTYDFNRNHGVSVRPIRKSN